MTSSPGWLLAFCAGAGARRREVEAETDQSSRAELTLLKQLGGQQGPEARGAGSLEVCSCS